MVNSASLTPGAIHSQVCPLSLAVPGRAGRPTEGTAGGGGGGGGAVRERQFAGRATGKRDNELNERQNWPEEEEEDGGDGQRPANVA